MASSYSSSNYMICHPEKLGISEIFSILVFGRRLVGSGLVETSIPPDQDTKLESVYGATSWVTVITWIIQKILLWLKGPCNLVGAIIEFSLNLFSLNGGIIGLFLHIFTGSLVIPKPDSASYRSILGHIDGRMDLYKTKSSLLSLLPKTAGSTLNQIHILDLCTTAAKLSYENQAYVNNVVTNHWKMHLVGFYNFWNDFQKENGTQAFIFCDRPENVQLIVVAFRGTEPFNTMDWSTDVDLSWLYMGNMGRVHVGFMKALGLQDEHDYKKGWPKDYTGEKELAYYTIREKLKTLLEQNKEAKIIVTGHSLGGALAILFPAILFLHQESTLLSSLLAVYTFGQPRVGDKEFGSYMEAQLNVIYKRYCRVVYRYDLVPRVPFDSLAFQFSHFGGCLYYRSWYKAKVLKKEPDSNYFNPLYIPTKYINAWLDLLGALFIGITHGKGFSESCTSLLFRVVGLFIPGLASHSPRDYVNGARLAQIIINPTEEEGAEMMT